MSEFLRVERAGHVATLWIDRQPKMNTMTVAMRVTNLLNRTTQEHVFGDLIGRAVIGEVRLAYKSR